MCQLLPSFLHPFHCSLPFFIRSTVPFLSSSVPLFPSFLHPLHCSLPFFTRSRSCDGAEVRNGPLVPRGDVLASQSRPQVLRGQQTPWTVPSLLCLRPTAPGRRPLLHRAAQRRGRSRRSLHHRQLRHRRAGGLERSPGGPAGVRLH